MYLNVATITCKPRSIARVTATYPNKERRTPYFNKCHWAIGSRKRKVQLGKYQEVHKDNPAFTHFTTKLLQFLDDALPADSVMTLPFKVTIFSLRVDIILFTYIPYYTTPVNIPESYLARGLARRERHSAM